MQGDFGEGLFWWVMAVFFATCVVGVAMMAAGVLPG